MSRSLSMAGCVVCTLLAACGVPVKVQRIADPATPVHGIRYTIRRPSYSAQLRVADPQTIALRRDGEFDPCTFDLLIGQNLQGEPLTYEVATAPHLFADTEISITTNQGALSAISAGETDRTMETMDAAVQLAISAAAGAAPGARGSCSERLPPALRRYAKEHLALFRGAERVRGLLRSREEKLSGTTHGDPAAWDAVLDGRRRIEELQRAHASHAKLERAQQRLSEAERRFGPAPTEAGDQSALLHEIDSLRKETAQREAQLAAHRFTLTPKQIHIRLADHLIYGDPTSVPWLNVQLGEQ